MGNGLRNPHLLTSIQDYGTVTCHTVPHPHRFLSQYNGSSFCREYPRAIWLCNLKSTRKNLEGARQHPQVVEEYLSRELHLNRIAGPYCKSKLPSIQISRFGIIPKRHQQNSWRLIIDLSHPKTNSVNDGIQKFYAGFHT